MPSSRRSPAAPPPLAARIAAAVALVALAAAMLGQVGRWVDWLDVVNDLAPLWAGPGLVAGALWLALRPGRGTLLVGSALLALTADRLSADWLSADWRDRPAAQPARSAGDPVLRIVQFNAWKENPSPRDSVRWILAQHADLVFIEEAWRDGTLLAGLSRAYPYQQACDAGRCTTLILSRVRPIAGAGLAHGDPENRGALSAAWMRVPTACGPLTAIATHMNRPAPWRGAERDLHALVEALDRLGRDRTVLAGDFNQTPWSFAMARQDAAIGLVRATRSLPTWISAAMPGYESLPPLLPLDHLYAAPSLRVLSVRRGPAIGSDHRPLVADLADTGCRDATAR